MDRGMYELKYNDTYTTHIIHMDNRNLKRRNGRVDESDNSIAKG